jgi:hypothetical protein
MSLTPASQRHARMEETEAPFRILDLPPDLVGLIFNELGDMDCRQLPQVRYVCRAFRDNSLAAIGTQFLESLVAILHSLSLTILPEITTHSNF